MERSQTKIYLPKNVSLYHTIYKKSNYFWIKNLNIIVLALHIPDHSGTARADCFMIKWTEVRKLLPGQTTNPWCTTPQNAPSILQNLRLQQQHNRCRKLTVFTYNK